MATLAALEVNIPKPSRFSIAQLLNLCVGIIGIQFAWSMQIALSSRVLEPLGANPLLFGLIWCAGPITGLVVQPIVGALSDRTTTRLGRRRPFILLGALLGAIALFLFPFSPTLLAATALIWIIDLCVNVSQGPYRALVPDNVPSEQHSIANSYMNFAFGAGSVISLGVAPLLKAFNVPMSIEQQYIMSAIALVLTIVYTSLTIREVSRPAVNAVKKKQEPLWASFKKFWGYSREIHKLCGVQFLTWMGIMCMFIYLTPFIVHNIFHLPDMSTPTYKRIEALNHVVTPIISQANPKLEALSAAEQALAQEYSLQGDDQINEANVNRLLTSTLDSQTINGLITPAMLEAVRHDTEKYKSLDFRLNQLLPQVLGTPLSAPTKKELEKLAQQQGIQSELAEHMALAGKGDSTRDQGVQQRFQSLLNTNKAAQEIAASVALSEAPKAEQYTVFINQYLDMEALKQLVQYKTFLVQYPLLAKPAVKTADQAQISPTPSSQLLFQETQKFNLLKKLENEATNTAQLALVAFNLVTLLLSIPLGYLCNRIGKKPVYSASLGCLAVAFAFAPFITTPMQAIIMMAFAGVAWATILSVPFAFLCDYIPPGEEGSVMGIFNMFVAGPQLISAIGIGWVISKSPMQTMFGVSHNWSIAFVVASVCVFLAILALQTIQEKPAGLPATSISGSGH